MSKDLSLPIHNNSGRIIMVKAGSSPEAHEIEPKRSGTFLLQKDQCVTIWAKGPGDRKLLYCDVRLYSGNDECELSLSRLKGPKWELRIKSGFWSEYPKTVNVTVGEEEPPR